MEPTSSTPPQPETSTHRSQAGGDASFSIAQPEAKRDRNWTPLAIASVAVVAVVVAMFALGRSGNHTRDLSTLPASPDAYAAHLHISALAMSESSNLAGSKLTYLDGHIANTGDRTVSEVDVQITFRDYANKVAQSQRLPLTVIRMREPYIDTALLSSAPLKPGAQADFRFNFDAISPDWSGAIPEVQILRAVTQ